MFDRVKLPISWRYLRRKCRPEELGTTPMRKQLTLISALVLVTALAIPSKSLAITPINRDLRVESSDQLRAFASAEIAPSGATVKIHSSTSMAGVNEVLEQGFESQVSGMDVEIEYSSSDAALAARQLGQTDLAAIGRSLTDEEKEQNLVEVPLSRRNIAIVVGADNQLPEGLSIVQFAKIIRGEIRDWSEVGGAPGAIRVVDRPHTNYARQALQTYPIFQNGVYFETGDNALKLSDDSTEAMVEELRGNGVSYAIADQVVDQPGVYIVPMHGNLPSDPQYPFSTPLAYVYQGPNPSPDVQAYLSYVATSENQKVIEMASQHQAIPLPDKTSGAVALMVTDITSSSASKEGEASDYPSEEKSAYPESKTALAQSSEDKSSYSYKYLPWWRWLTLLPVLAIFLWSFIHETQDEVEYDSTDKTSASR